MRSKAERFGVRLSRSWLLGALFGAGCAFALSACSPTLDLSEGDPVPSAYPIHGVDVSYYQGTIDWPSVRANGTTFAYIKAPEGGDRPA